MSRLTWWLSVIPLVTLAKPGDAQIRAGQLQSAACQVFLETDPGKARLTEPIDSMLKTCFDSITSRATNVRSAQRQRDSVVKLDGQEIDSARLGLTLINEHAAYTELKTWYMRAKQDLGAEAVARSGLTASFEEAKDVLHDALGKRGLNQAFSAALVSGAILGNGEGLQSGVSEQTTNVAAHLVWESKHIGDDDRGLFDFAVGGRVGFQPALSLVSPSSGAASSTDTQSVYQEAFVWDLGFRVNHPFLGRHSSELSLVGRLGQTVLGSQSVLLEQGGRATLAVPVGNGAGSAEWFYEVGLEYNLFNNPLDVVHAEGSTVSPLFSLGFLLRKDNRFKREGALAVFDAPARRGVFRFMIDALDVVDKRETAEKPRTFTVGFGVEHEFGFGKTPRVPVGTKLVFRGDVDLLRALQGR